MTWRSTSARPYRRHIRNAFPDALVEIKPVLSQERHGAGLAPEAAVAAL